MNFFVIFFFCTRKFLDFFRFLAFLSTYLDVRRRKKFTFVFRSTLSISTISWMHLFYYFSSNPRYEVTVRRTLRPIALKSFVNLNCMLTATSIKHRDMRLDLELCWENESEREWERREKNALKSMMIVMLLMLTMCIMLRSSAQNQWNRIRKEFWFGIILCMLADRLFNSINIQMIAFLLGLSFCLSFVEASHLNRFIGWRSTLGHLTADAHEVWQQCPIIVPGLWNPTRRGERFGERKQLKKHVE